MTEDYALLDQLEGALLANDTLRALEIARKLVGIEAQEEPKQ
jgi:hypothetical protein